MEKVKVQLSITQESKAAMLAAATERKCGEWVSMAILAHARPAQPTGVIEQLTAQLVQLSERVDRLLTQGQ